jgi:hypothetical protein
MTGNELDEVVMQIKANIETAKLTGEVKTAPRRRLPTWGECIPYIVGVGVIVFLGVYPKIRENMPIGDSIETCWRFPDECNKLHPEEYAKRVARMLEVQKETDHDDRACEALERVTQGRRLCEVYDDREDER